MQKASFKEHWPKLIFTYLCMYPNNGATLLKELPEIRLVAAFRSSRDAFAMETRPVTERFPNLSTNFKVVHHTYPCLKVSDPKRETEI